MGLGESVYTSSTPKLSVEPSSIININMVPPTTFTINITIKDVTDLYSFNFSLNYSTTVLTATAVTLGSFFPPNSKSWKEDINDALGYVRYVVTLPPGTLPGGGLNGSGTLATIDFTVDDLGETVLDLCNTKLGDSQPKYIPHTVYDGYFANILRPSRLDSSERPTTNHTNSLPLFYPFLIHYSYSWSRKKCKLPSATCHKFHNI